MGASRLFINCACEVAKRLATKSWGARVAKEVPMFRDIITQAGIKKL